MITFFDTETNGLPKNWKLPMSAVNNWPRVIQLAWTICENDGKVVRSEEILIKPDHWVIPKDKFWLDHGFSTEKSEADGYEMEEVLKMFTNDIMESEYMVAHNMAFDRPVVGAEMIRYGIKAKKIPAICTMTDAAIINFCAIPHKIQRNAYSKDYKWPKLEELHMKLFGVDFNDKHQAGGDVAALKDCFFKLVADGILKPENYKL